MIFATWAQTVLFSTQSFETSGLRGFDVLLCWCSDATSAATLFWGRWGYFFFCCLRAPQYRSAAKCARRRCAPVFDLQSAKLAKLRGWGFTYFAHFGGEACCGVSQVVEFVVVRRTCLRRLYRKSRFAACSATDVCRLGESGA